LIEWVNRNFHFFGRPGQSVDVLQCEGESKLIRLVESLEKKHDEGTWTDRISEEVEEVNL
jgi:hypothetical protein